MAVPTSFPLGRLLATPGALEALTAAGQTPGHFLARHSSGDWGLVDEEDWRLNDEALRDGTRLLSAYETHQGVKFWIVTEADRSATTVLLPDEY